MGGKRLGQGDRDGTQQTPRGMMTGAVGSKQLLGSGGRDCGKANGKQHAERGKLGMTGQTAVDGKGPKQGELERGIRALVHLTQAPQDLPPAPHAPRPTLPDPAPTHHPFPQATDPTR